MLEAGEQSDWQMKHRWCCAVLFCLQEEAIRELSAALQAKDEELSDARKQAAAEADAAVLQRMQVGAQRSWTSGAGRTQSC